MNSALPILVVILQIAGFVGFCILGGRLSTRLARARSEWIPLIAGFVVIGLACLVLYLAGQPLGVVPQTAAVFLIAFGGGLVASVRERLRRG